MWGVIDESSDNPLAELWGLFKSDDDVSWQHRALCSQTDPEARINQGCQASVRPVRGS